MIIEVRPDREKRKERYKIMIDGVQRGVPVNDPELANRIATQIHGKNYEYAKLILMEPEPA